MDILEAARKLGLLQGSSQAAPAMLATLCNATSNAADVGEIIRQEPGLAARVLRVANSAFYGQSRSISTIERAIVVLGLDAVRGIAATACLDRTMGLGALKSPVDVGAIHRHSLATAAGAEAIARIRHRAMAPEAFIAGLLHDFGVLLQLRLNPEGLAEMVASPGQPDTSLEAFEVQVVGIGHEACAVVVFEAWNLPPALVAAILHHHDPAAAPGGDQVLATLLNLGDGLSRECSMAGPGESAESGDTGQAMDLLGISAEQLATARSGLTARVRELQRALA